MENIKEEILFEYNRMEWYGEDKKSGLNNGYERYYIYNEEGEKQYKALSLPIDKIRKLINNYNKEEVIVEKKEKSIVNSNYKIKTTNGLVNEDHFKMFLQHDGNMCLCPNEEHCDINTGSVTFSEFASGNIGIHCWVCGETWNLYDTIKMVDKNSILKYNKIINNIDYELINSNETVVKKANITKIKENVKQYYSNYFDIKNYYNNILGNVLNENNELYKASYIEQLTKQMKTFCPFMFMDINIELNKEHLKRLKWDRNNESLVIPFFLREDLRNCFLYNDPRGKYVPVLKWKRKVNEEIIDFYNRPIFLQECLENRLKNKNKFIIICEGVKDTFNANLMGYSAITTGGVTNTKPLTEKKDTIEIIEKAFDYIVIALDNDKAGNDNMYRYINLFNKDKIINITKLFNYGEDFSDFMVRMLKNDKNFRLEL